MYNLGCYWTKEPLKKLNRLTLAMCIKAKKVIWGDRLNPLCQNDAQLVLKSDFVLITKKGFPR
jgi:hypothetical protein